MRVALFLLALLSSLLPGRAALFGHELPRAPHALIVKLPGPQRVTFPATAHITIGGRQVTVAAGTSEGSERWAWAPQYLSAGT